MDIYSSIVLAIVQGITEYLPISSSAHLLFVRKVLNLAYSHAFDVFLNIGTISAILIYYRKETLKLVIGFKDLLCLKSSASMKFLLNVCIASIPTIIVFGIAEMFLGGQLKSIFLLAISLMVFSMVIYFCDKYFEATKTDEPNLKEWFVVGLAQVLSIVPGISRLGVTSSAFRVLRYSRATAFKYSMILSIPAVLGACFLKLIKIITGEIITPQLSCIFYGILFSFIIGLLMLKVVNLFLERHTYLVFVIYRILFGVLILVSIIYFDF